MTLSEKQSIFTLNIAKLIAYAFQIGYKLTFGEGYRTHDQQLLYFEGYTLIKSGSNLKLVKRGKLSKTMNSKHLSRLAHDFNVFYEGKLLGDNDKELFAPLADFWNDLDELNVSGYNWGWDMGHFEMK